jgi:hypothetical protein
MSVLCGGGGKRLQVAQCFLKTDHSQLGHKTVQVCDVQRKLVKTKKTSLQNQNRRQNVKERAEDISKTSLISRANAIFSTCI